MEIDKFKDFVDNNDSCSNVYVMSNLGEHLEISYMCVSESGDLIIVPKSADRSLTEKQLDNRGGNL